MTDAFEAYTESDHLKEIKLCSQDVYFQWHSFVYSRSPPSQPTLATALVMLDPVVLAMLDREALPMLALAGQQMPAPEEPVTLVQVAHLMPAPVVERTPAPGDHLTPDLVAVPMPVQVVLQTQDQAARVTLGRVAHVIHAQEEDGTVRQSVNKKSTTSFEMRIAED